jgi:hypothetical protein
MLKAEVKKGGPVGKLKGVDSLPSFWQKFGGRVFGRLLVPPKAK